MAANLFRRIKLYSKNKILTLFKRLLLLLLFGAAFCLQTGSVSGNASDRDLPLALAFYCNNTAGDALVDAFAYFEKAQIMGIWFSERYWEVKFLHGSGYPTIHRYLGEVGLYWESCSKEDYEAEGNPNECLKPTGSRAPWIDSVHVLKDKVYILFAPKHTDGQTQFTQRWIYEFRYDPSANEKPTFIAKYFPELAMPQLYYTVFNNPRLSATMVTIHPTEPEKRIVWTNERNYQRTLKAWTPEQQTYGGNPSYVYSIKKPDEVTAEAPNLIWSLDTFHIDRQNGSVPVNYILNLRRYKRNLRFADVTYLLQYQLTVSDSGQWIFERVPHLLWDVMLLMGCPQSFCFDTTLDGGLADQRHDDQWRVILFRGPYIFQLNYTGPAYKMRYPVSSPIKKPNDVLSLRDVIENKEEYAADGQWPVDAVLYIPKTDAADQKEDTFYKHVYLIKRDRFFLYHSTRNEEFYKRPQKSGHLKDMLDGYTFPAGTILDAFWYSNTEKKLYIFWGHKTVACKLDGGKPKRGLQHKFSGCTSVGRPADWRPRVDATLTYAGQTKTLFTHVSSGWYVNDNNGAWKSESYDPFFVHPVGNQSKAIYHDPENWCDYTTRYNHIKQDDIWIFLAKYQQVNYTEAITPEDKTKTAEPLPVGAIIGWIFFGLLCIAVIVGVAFWYRRQKKKDESFLEERLEERASYRSTLSGLGGKGPEGGGSQLKKSELSNRLQTAGSSGMTG